MTRAEAHAANITTHELRALSDVVANRPARTSVPHASTRHGRAACIRHVDALLMGGLTNPDGSSTCLAFQPPKSALNPRAVATYTRRNEAAQAAQPRQAASPPRAPLRRVYCRGVWCPADWPASTRSPGWSRLSHVPDRRFGHTARSRFKKIVIALAIPYAGTFPNSPIYLSTYCRVPGSISENGPG